MAVIASFLIRKSFDSIPSRRMARARSTFDGSAVLSVRAVEVGDATDRHDDTNRARVPKSGRVIFFCSPVARFYAWKAKYVNQLWLTLRLGQRRYLRRQRTYTNAAGVPRGHRSQGVTSVTLLLANQRRRRQPRECLPTRRQQRFCASKHYCIGWQRPILPCVTVHGPPSHSSFSLRCKTNSSANRRSTWFKNGAPMDCSTSA